VGQIAIGVSLQRIGNPPEARLDEPLRFYSETSVRNICGTLNNRR